MPPRLRVKPEVQATVNFSRLNLLNEARIMGNSGHPLDPQKLKRDLIEKIEAAAHSPLVRKYERLQSVTAPPPSQTALQEGNSTSCPRSSRSVLPPEAPKLFKRYCRSYLPICR